MRDDGHGSANYPKRPPYFAHRLVRAAMKTCLAQEIGPTATLLVIFVAHTEDAKRYSTAPTFYNDQLLPILGLRKWEALDKARRDAVAAGWLVYQAPPTGSRRCPGTYWSTIPERLALIDDQPADEDSDRAPCEADTPNGYGRGYGGGDGAGDGAGDGRGYGGGELPSLIPAPSPDPLPSSKLRFSEADTATAKWMLAKIKEIDPKAKANLDGWANHIRLMRERDERTDAAIRDLFEWANRDKFWKSNILGPAKLREKWTQLAARRSTETNGDGYGTRANGKALGGSGRVHEPGRYANLAPTARSSAGPPQTLSAATTDTASEPD
jgi:hypothetical protein